jgi:hypothetical protein
MWTFSPGYGGSIFLQNVGITNKSTWYYNPEDQHHQYLHHGENIKSHPILLRNCNHGGYAGLDIQCSQTDTRNRYRVVMSNPLEKRPRRLEDNIKMQLRNIG